MNETDKFPMEVRMRFPVQTYDIDFAGIVSNIVYIRWLEDLRLKVLETHYPIERMLREQLAPTLVETHIRYRKSIRIGDEVTGRIWISQMRRMKFLFRAEFLVNGTLAATAKQTGCVVDLESGSPAALPEAFRLVYQAQAETDR